MTRLVVLLALPALAAAFLAPMALDALGGSGAAAPPAALAGSPSTIHEAVPQPPSAPVDAGGQGSESWSATASGTPVPERVLTPEVQPAPSARPQDPDGGTVVLFTPGDGSQGAAPPTGDASSPTPVASQQQPAPEPLPENPNPIRAAFYYPWFPQAWSQEGISPFTAYHPTLGYYNSADPNVIRRHIEAMQYGQITAGIASWWGRDHYTDAHFADLLQVSRGTGFKWAIYYEPEGWGTPSPERIRADLDYIRDRYAAADDYLRVDGRFVVFVYSSGEDRCEMADRWKQSAPADAFVVLKAFPNNGDCSAQPDAWHYYNPLVYTAGLGRDSFAISPGYSKPGDANVVPRDLGRWRASVEEMSRSAALFQLVLTFNEWGEGTSVESADEWASDSGFGAYLDVLHEIAP